MNELAAEPAFVDTSVIVRYLVRDDPILTEQARRIIEEHQALNIPTVMVAEAAFVLTTVYSFPRDAVVDALISLLQRRNISVDQLDIGIVIQALMLCRPSGRVSFADAMLWAVARSSGAGSVVYTLDRRFPSAGITVRNDFPESTSSG